MDMMSMGLVMCIQMDALQTQMLHQNIDMMTTPQKYTSQQLYNGKGYWVIQEDVPKRSAKKVHIRNEPYYSLNEKETESSDVEITNFRTNEVLAYMRSKNNS